MDLGVNAILAQITQDYKRRRLEAPEMESEAEESDDEARSACADQPVEPTLDLKDSVCEKHSRPLELFCSTDHACICTQCAEEDHAGHAAVPVEGEWLRRHEELKTEVLQVKQGILDRQKKTEELKRQTRLSREDAEERVKEGQQTLDAILRSVERCQSELEEAIEGEQRVVESKAQGLLKELEQEIKGLNCRKAQLKEVSRCRDHVRVLESLPSQPPSPCAKDWDNVLVHPNLRVGTVRSVISPHDKYRRATNVGSILLTPQENECLFNYLGRKCISLCSAVVQVFAADRNSSWMKRCCGVACLVKDNPQRSYFIRVFDIKDGKMMFEQEFYNNFSISCSRSYFISFPGDSCQVGLNFANEEEAKRFRAAAGELLGRRQRKTEKRRDPPNGPALPMATVDIKNPEINNVRFHNNNIMHSSFSKDRKKAKGKRKRLTKADIGTPSNFQHIGHVGWDPNTGFDLNNLDPELKNLFDMCGISEAQLKDRETSKVIYDFIEKKGGVEAVKNELRRQGPPRWCGRALRRRPRPRLLRPGPRPGPPPPPHPQNGGGEPLPSPQGKSALLEQIRGGTQLKRVEPGSRPVSSTGRDALLDQIRQGIQLKTVTDGPDSAPPTPAPSAGIVGALMEVMQKRSKAIHSSDEDEDDDEEEDFEDDDEWDD
ncbi:hypothetical protein COCON_G00228580 [Conger conger]|uniref:Actin nucleation-promoting factor WASL n=1 Tax=Conger conger TaxID=82655 RepID=A0A9Q1CVD6_CONCO|nr:hypothetical protein COCON_G00228580 [Conger conger]